MTFKACQIIINLTVYPTDYSGDNKKTPKNTRITDALWWESTAGRWISITKGKHCAAENISISCHLDMGMKNMGKYIHMELII